MLAGGEVGMKSLPDDAFEKGNIGRGMLAKASWRLLPLIGLGYGVAYMDRVNISFAAARMNTDLHFSATVYGLGGGLFFLAYALFEVPSNLLLARVGARRWLARIMFTWGLLAVGMMFVRTPIQFYVMRFMLGGAEAGFFPGAVYYLMRWFPADQRGRAISRFYVAFPLSGVFMGAVAGALLGLQGRLGLAGWQWLFLVEGLPAILMSAVFLFCLPETPAQAKWLSDDERSWLAARLRADDAAVQDQTGHGLRQVLTNPMVLAMGAVNFLYLGSGYAFTLSAPTLLGGATGLGPARVGYLVATASLLGAVSMMAVAWRSDRTGERHLHLAIPLMFEAAGYAIMNLWHSPLAMMGAYVLTVVAHSGAAAVFWLIPSDALRGRPAAIGVAAINGIGMMGSFLAPLAWGMLKDSTGDFQTGLRCLPALLLVAAGIILALRLRRGASARALMARSLSSPAP
jgi:ACS family tartrate transporter-like MFS transporter